MILNLDEQELTVLFRQSPGTKKEGGFQGFLVSLQERVNESSATLDLTESDLEKIPRYAFDYGNGGWENRLKAIFERHLGSNLGR